MKSLNCLSFFCIMLKKFLSFPKSQRCSPLFLSGSFDYVTFIFRSKVNSELSPCSSISLRPYHVLTYKLECEKVLPASAAYLPYLSKYQLEMWGFFWYWAHRKAPCFLLWYHVHFESTVSPHSSFIFRGFTGVPSCPALYKL